MNIRKLSILWFTSQKGQVVLSPIFILSHAGHGDYIEIPQMQNNPAPTLPAIDGSVGVNRICGILFNANPASGQTVHTTICSYATPFRVLVHFDSDEVIGDNSGNGFGHIENENPTVGAGIGYTGFWLDYWQNTC